MVSRLLGCWVAGLLSKTRQPSNLATQQPSSFPHRFPALPQQKIAVPCVIERLVEGVDSDEARRCLFEPAELHLGAAEEVEGADDAGVLEIRVDQLRESRLRLHEVAMLVRAERERIGVGAAARGRGGGG